MPVDPATIDRLATDVVGLYATAEQRLLQRMATYLDAGLEAPDWVVRKLTQLTAYREEAEAVAKALEKEAAGKASAALHEAYAKGGQTAAAELAGLGTAAAKEGAIATHALEALVADTTGALASTGPRILRSSMDVYRSVVAQTAESVLTGTLTRRQAAQQALNRFAAKGVTGFVDKAGRGWDLASYTEMAMRTGTANAARQGQMDRLQAMDHDLVIVSDAPQECPLCAPWEGRVLSISGKDSRYPSVAEAEAAGLHHPNCRHSESIYIPGVTQKRKAEHDPEGYEAKQQQRRLEREIRASKRMEAAAMDDTAKRAAAARTRAYQKKLREHVDAHDLKRLRAREQVGRAI